MSVVMSDLDRPESLPKRPRTGVGPLAILDSPATQTFNQALNQAMDDAMPETIEDMSSTQAAPSQARVNWSAMNTRSMSHIPMLPSLSFSPFAVPPTQPDIPPTQPDYEPTQLDIGDTLIDYSPTQINDTGFLPTVPENVPSFHVGTPRVAQFARSSSSVGARAVVQVGNGRRRIVGKQPPPRRRINKKRPPKEEEKPGRRRINGKQKPKAKARAKAKMKSGCPPGEADSEAFSFAFAPTPDVSSNVVRASDDPVSQFSSQATPRVPERVPSRSALSQFRSFQERSRAKAPALRMGQADPEPRRRQLQLPGERMRRRISREETFVSTPIGRPLQRLPVRPITPHASVPQFRQQRINDVINNVHDVVNLDLQRWMEMGLSEFSRHDVLMKVPGFPLTRYRLVSSFRFRTHVVLEMNSTNQGHFSPRGPHDSYVLLEVTLQHNRYYATHVCFVIGPSRGGACPATSPSTTSKRQMRQMPNSDPKCLCGQEKTMSLGAGAARRQV